jgi:hypothetical protein
MSKIDPTGRIAAGSEHYKNLLGDRQAISGIAERRDVSRLRMMTAVAAPCRLRRRAPAPTRRKGCGHPAIDKGGPLWYIARLPATGA